MYFLILILNLIDSENKSIINVDEIKLTRKIYLKPYSNIKVIIIWMPENE